MPTGIHPLEPVTGHDVAFEPDRLRPMFFISVDLFGGVRGRVVQEQVRVVAASWIDRHAVDLESPKPLV
jgi:hypothetical protein